MNIVDRFKLINNKNANVLKELEKDGTLIYLYVGVVTDKMIEVALNEPSIVMDCIKNPEIFNELMILSRERAGCDEHPELNYRMWSIHSNTKHWSKMKNEKCTNKECVIHGKGELTFGGDFDDVVWEGDVEKQYNKFLTHGIPVYGILQAYTVTYFGYLVDYVFQADGKYCTHEQYLELAQLQYTDGLVFDLTLIGTIPDWRKQA